jgi:hypothetical protein
MARVRVMAARRTWCSVSSCQYGSLVRRFLLVRARVTSARGYGDACLVWWLGGAGVGDETPVVHTLCTDDETVVVGVGCSE